MKLIFLDDERNFEDVTWIDYPEYSEIIVVRTYKDFIKEIDSLITLKNVHISFDHDLQDFDHNIEYTGKTCANYLVDKLLDGELEVNYLKYFLHTKNPVGQANIKGILEGVVNHIEQEEDQKDFCDGCGAPSTRISFGYSICNNCDDYSVRGLSRSDFL